MTALPLYEERAIYVPSTKTVVISDVHIGIEYEFSSMGANIPSQTESMLKRCIGICDEKKAEKLIILGDVKHAITPSGAIKDERSYMDALSRERKDLKFFLESLSEVVDIFLVKGNHDGGLRTGKNFYVHPSHGIIIEEIGFVHGHAWPSEELMKGKILVMGHVHPVVRIKDSFGYVTSKPCWVRATMKKEPFLKKYSSANENMKVIIMPSFNPLCGGMAVNTEGIMGPMKNIVDIENANAYLLNGTNLGRIGSLH